MATISITLPIYNEAATISTLYERLNGAAEQISHEMEFVFVDDGSTDATYTKLAELSANDPRIKIVRLSRNFGHQAACTAGLRNSDGDAVVLMDGDLQDPPEVIPELVEAWERGYRVVLARRKSRYEEGLRGWAMSAFYKAFEWLSDVPLPHEVGIFSLMDKTAAQEVAALPERHRYIPGLRWWVGFNVGEVWYDRERRFAGAPKQTLRRLIRYALDAIFGYSYKPLRLAMILGLIVSTASFAYGTILLLLRILGINVVAGFTTQAVAILFLGGLNLTFIGILGEYIARTYDEVKHRPLYVVSEIVKGGNRTVDAR